MHLFTRPIRTIAGALVAVAVAVLAACSGTDAEGPVPAEPTESTSSVAPSSPSTSDTATAEPTEEALLLSVNIDGERVLPNAEEIDLSTGEALRVEIRSDRAGELHVHSTPEQFLEFAAGTTKTNLVITTPGSVEVEDHDTGAVVALVEVR